MRNILRRLFRRPVVITVDGPGFTDDEFRAEFGLEPLSVEMLDY